MLIVPAVFVEFFDRAAAWRSTIMLLLAINTVLSILQVEKLLDRKDVAGSSSRLNAAIAGFIIQSIFNLLLILLSGSRTAMNSAYGEDRDVGVASYPAKSRAPAPTTTAPQVTVVRPHSSPKASRGRIFLDTFLEGPVHLLSGRRFGYIGVLLSVMYTLFPSASLSLRVVPL